MRKQFISLLLAVFAVAVYAQPVISPVPQEIRVNSGAPLPQTISFSLKKTKALSPAMLEFVKTSFRISDSGIPLYVGSRKDKAVSKVRKSIPQHEEGYYLQFDGRAAYVAGYDEDGVFYGLQTLLQVVGAEHPQAVTVTDFPEMPNRGVIEGYYGNPYSHQDRLRLFDFMGQNKMNVFVYGPKDDPYHRSHWREDYPERDGALMRSLVDRANKNRVKFVWAIHPGGDIKWNLEDSLAIVRKCETVYRLGVRNFCVFFDDIWGEGAKGEKQAALLNYIHKEFVEKHKDVEPLIMCPTQYNKGWSHGDYLKVLGEQMHPSVRIMWTGNTVVDMIDRKDMEWINAQIGRKAFVWLNYPVTDYCIDHLLMGKTYGNENVADQVSGFCSNPMEYCEASKVSLFSLADYWWNPDMYNDEASWQLAIRRLQPHHAKAFRVFCENNVDLGKTGHGLRREGESPAFIKYLEKGDRLGLLATYQEMLTAAEELLSASDDAMLQEIRPWVEVMKCVAQRGIAAHKMGDAMVQNDSIAFINEYKAYEKAYQQQRKIRSRDFEGSIKVATPVVATNFVEPFLRMYVKQLQSKYLASHTYGAEVFPKQEVADGRYFVKLNGIYLTDPNYSQPNVAAVLVTYRDTINPQSQEFHVTMDTDTERYKLVNVQSNRYLNEIGRFGTNPYSPHWNTYVLKRQPSGKFTIQNAESAGTKYWTETPDGKGLGYSTEPDARFELIPIN